MTLKVDLMRNFNLKGKRVLIREDLNVPVKNGRVSSDARIRAALPTIEAAVSAGARVILMSHLGRPVEGEFDPQFSMAPVAAHLGGLLGKPVPLVSDWRGGVTLADGEVAML
jgi:phosphoglycerate kinase